MGKIIAEIGIMGKRYSIILVPTLRFIIFKVIGFGILPTIIVAKQVVLFAHHLIAILLKRAFSGHRSIDFRIIGTTVVTIIRVHGFQLRIAA
jgi:hypothetical protein